MPDTPVDPRDGDPYHSDMEARVRLLEEVVARIDRRLDDLTAEVRSLRSDIGAEFRAVRSEHRSDFRWLLGTMLGLSGAGFALMAHGFHWLP